MAFYRPLVLISMALFAGASAQASERLRVLLLSGNKEPIYRAEESLSVLESYLESEQPFDCEHVTLVDGGTRLSDPTALERADAAVIFVRRKSPDPATLSAIKRFVASGKGVVALRTTSHAWENWPEFDQEVLGADYGRHAGAAQALEFPDPDHPILTGALGFATSHDLYHYTLNRESPDLQVLLKGTSAKGEQPVAWTTSHQKTRIFYLGLGHREEFQKPGYLRMISNALHWVSHRLVPGAEVQIERTYMPEAAPSAFGIGFSNGVSFCYDPVRGGLNYAWSGGYIDRAAVRPGMGKHIKPVALYGKVFYREAGMYPLRRDDPTREPNVNFTGYRLGEQSVEFSYTVDGVPVQEEIRPRPGGDGLTRSFRIGEDGRASTWWYLPGSTDSKAQLLAPAGSLDGSGLRFAPSQSGGFVIEIVYPGLTS